MSFKKASSERWKAGRNIEMMHRWRKNILPLVEWKILKLSRHDMFRALQQITNQILLSRFASYLTRTCLEMIQLIYYLKYCQRMLLELF